MITIRLLISSPQNRLPCDLLWEICREIGLDRRQIYTTNVVKYRPPNNEIKRLPEIGINIDDCISQLWDEIIAINPNIIVALGNTPLRALTGKDKILKWRGSVLKSSHMNFKVLATIHPAALLHAESDVEEPNWKKLKGPLMYSYRHILKLDLLRALKQSASNLYDPPERVIEIGRDYVTLQRFLDLYRHKDMLKNCSHRDLIPPSKG